MPVSYTSMIFAARDSQRSTCLTTYWYILLSFYLIGDICSVCNILQEFFARALRFLHFHVFVSVCGNEQGKYA